MTFLFLSASKNFVNYKTKIFYIIMESKGPVNMSIERAEVVSENDIEARDEE